MSDTSLIDQAKLRIGAIASYEELREASNVWHVNANTKAIQEWTFWSGSIPRGPHDQFVIRPVNRSYTETVCYSDVGIGQNVLPDRKNNCLFRTKAQAQEYVAALKSIRLIEGVKRRATRKAA